MSTLTHFLLARIAEDEEAARFGQGPWRSIGASDCGCCVRIVEKSEALLGDLDIPHAEHILRHDPVRVLTECKAKRRIVEAFEDERQRKDIYNRDYPLGLLTTEGDLHARLSANARWAGLDVAMHALASVYSDHPDYPEDWTE